MLSYYLQQKRLYPINSNINIIIIPITSLGIINIKNMPNPTMKKEYPIKRFMFFSNQKDIYHYSICPSFSLSTLYVLLLLFYTVLILHPYLLHQIKFHSSQTLLLSWILHLTLQLLPHPSFPWMQTYLRNLVPYQEFWSHHPDS